MGRVISILTALIVVFVTAVLGFFGMILVAAYGLVIVAVSVVWAGCTLWAAICAIAWAAGMPNAPLRFAWALAAAGGSFGVLAPLWWPAMALWIPMPKPEPDAPFLESGAVELRR